MNLKPKILLVVDELFGEVLKQGFEEKCYEVTIMESYGRYEHILGTIKHEKFLLAILTNTTLTPPMILELIPLIKANQIDLPVLVLSGHTEHDFVIELKKLGIVDFVSIPFDITDLLSTVKRSIKT